MADSTSAERTEHPGADLPSVAASDPYETIVDGDRLVTMRDGVRLAADIYMPARNGVPLQGPFPVILERTPYGKTTTTRCEIDRSTGERLTREQVAEYFVGHGYVVIYQDCRGRGRSEGVFVKYFSEGPDGVDTVAWIRQQPWCDGKVGMMGLSYAAHTQVAPAALDATGLAALIVDCGGFSCGYHWGMRQGGALELRQATWAFVQAKESQAAQNDPLVRASLDAEDIGAWFGAMPWKPGHSPLRWVPEYEDYFFDQWRSGDFDDSWKRNGIYLYDSYPELARVPQIHLSGWYDTYVATAVENYLGVAAQPGAEVKLIIGPWTHGERASHYSGDVDFGNAAPVDGNLAKDWRALRLNWFDRFLKGKMDVGTDLDNPVHLFVMGGGSGKKNEAGRLCHGGHWISGPTWPPAGTIEETMFLTASGALVADAPTKAETRRGFRFDPAKPVPTIGGAFSSGAPLFHPGGFDQRETEAFYGCTRPGMPLSARTDVLVFQTDVLEEDVILAGPVEAVLWVSSDQPDTDVTAKLIDEYPPSVDYPRGYAMNLTDGILRLRYRNGFETPEMMEPGTNYEITVTLMPTANLFRAGHRIRLDVSSSNFPKFDINPNSGEAPSRADYPRVATNTLHFGEDFPSRLVVRRLRPEA